MKFYFTAYDFPGILSRLKQHGHEIVSVGQWGDGKAQTDAWWNHMLAGSTPQQHGQYLVTRVEETEADVVVIGKGWHAHKHHLWSIDTQALLHLRKTGKKLVYLSWDDPDQIPIAIQTGMLRYMDAIGTCCPDPNRSTKPYRDHAPYAKIFLFWPGWDQAAWEPTMAEPVEETCDVLFGGTPHVQPNAEYAGPPRRDIARAALAKGWKVEVWGPVGWKDPRQGGPDLIPHYRGKYSYRERGSLWRRAKVNVNVHLRYGIYGYANDRLFMQGGCGRAFVCDNQPGLKEFFPEGIYFKGGDLDDLMRKMTLLKNDEAMRRDLGARLRTRILKHHTLAHRTDVILQNLTT